jgi:hypothetical protein
MSGDRAAVLYAELEHWPEQRQMASLLVDAGLKIKVGQYSIRVECESHFVFQHYGMDVSEPVIEADADSLEQLLMDAKMVSNALAHGGVRHRFEIYFHENKLVAYLHHDWSLEEL